MSSCRLIISSETSPLLYACKIISSFSKLKVDFQVMPQATVGFQPKLVVDNSEFQFAGPILRFVSGDWFQQEPSKFRAEIDSWTTWAELNLANDELNTSALSSLNALIGARAFICGNKPTMADAVAFAFIRRENVKLMLQGNENLFRWYETCSQLPEFMNAYPKPTTEKEGAKAELSAKDKKKEAKALAKAQNTPEPVKFPNLSVDDIDNHSCGNLVIQSQSRTGRVWTAIESLNESLAETSLWLRARVHHVRKQSSKLVFLVLREGPGTVQAVVFGSNAQFAAGLTKESVVEIYGKITVPKEPVHSTTQKTVEVQVEKVFAISRAAAVPLQMEDLERTEAEIQAGTDAGEVVVRVPLDTRLNNRVIDMRTRTNQAIFNIQSGVCNLFREFLLSKGFKEIHTPKMIATASEGGADVFRLNYFGGYGYLAQSPQLYKQMAVMGDIRPGVFEIAPVFRAENSFTHRHMTEFIGLDIEMLIKEHFHEVLDTMDELFAHIFNGLNNKYKAEIETVKSQHPFEDLKYEYPSKRFRFDEAVRILKAEGPSLLKKDIEEAESRGDLVRKDQLEKHLATVLVHEETEDLGTSDEKLLGRVMKNKFDTDFYFIEKFPRAVRAFYTMPCPEEPEKWSNSYDMFVRGEEIVSGAQRIHDPELLLEVAKSKNVDLSPIQDYVDAFKYGAHPHGGAGIGLERVVMLFLNLPNIRYASMFPRDPKRITP
jgi:aspartyl-tRNA synthetase